MSDRDAQDGASEPGGSTPAAQAAPRRLLLEPWGVGYAGSAQDVGGTAFGDADDDPLGGPGDERPLLGAEALSVEVPLADWRALRPAAPLAVAQLLFLDGVRRVEARAVLEGAAPAFGALGSCAVGAVTCDLAGGGRAAIVEDVVVERWCAIAIDTLTDETDVLVPTGPYGPVGSGAEAAPRLRFRVTQAKGTDWQAPVEQLQVVMRDAERRLAARLRGHLAGAGEAGSRALLVCDGPRPLFGADENVIGYLKTIKEQRLPAAALAVVRRLEEGERSPVYLVGEGEHARFEWYLRLRDPRPWLHTLAGSVRVQAHAGPAPHALLDTATAIADWSAAQLPRFATKAHQDPRAPQQLLPVRFLEAALRRRLGNAPLVRRRIEVALADTGKVVAAA